MTAAPLVSTMAAPALAAAPNGSGGPLTPASLDRPVATTSIGASAPPGLDRPASRGPTAGVESARALNMATGQAGRTSRVRQARPDVDNRPAAAGYVVRPGDTLWAIAARQLGPHATAAQIAAQWPRWYASDRSVIGDDPNLIRPGELLRAPPP
jgi:nucleoid-associated protein YgaU